ncbi:MAG: hypothetical protein LBC18_12150 [Opitutaceae bacterium]|jgi:hypothetical protein|nr:hypothetical protein [Opitutaceae bacterium]
MRRRVSRPSDKTHCATRKMTRKDLDKLQEILAGTALLAGYDAAGRCIHRHLLINDDDQGWSMATARHPKYRRLGVQSLRVLLFSSDGRGFTQLFEDIPPARPRKKKQPAAAPSISSNP